MYDATTNHRTTRLCTAAMLSLAVGAFAADQYGSLTPVRMTLHSLLSPGRFVLAAMANRPKPAATQPSAEPPDELADLQNALLQNELQRRQLVIENAQLRNELTATKQQTNAQIVSGGALINFVLTPARVLSHSGTPQQLRDLFIDAGTERGLQPSQLVVEGPGILIDQGHQQQVLPDQPVISGLAVAGRVVQTADWVSLIQPITDVDYSAGVQLVNHGSNGSSFAAKGLLEGTGDDLCRIRGVPHTAAVSAGDEVYSSDMNGVQGPPLYFGTVVRAEFSAGGEWEIQVRPAINLSQLREVAVVRPQLNSSRLRRSGRQSAASRQRGGANP